jgi:hypothetical protein
MTDAHARNMRVRPVDLLWKTMLDTEGYKANFTTVGLMTPESRIVADLLLQRVDAAVWKQAIEVDNAVANRSPMTASTKSTPIRGRLQTMTEGLWHLVRDGSGY